jgi:hypothetical protein
VQDTDRKAFDEILAEIFAAIDKPLGEAQRSVFWKGLKDMGVLEFARIRDLLLKDYREREEPPRKFTLGDIWTARKRLRAIAPRTDEAPPWPGDEWDRRGNLRMLSLVLRAAYARRRLAEAEIHLRVAFKNRWTDLMRASGTPETVPLADQTECWASCMRMAEEAFAQERAA